MNASQPRLQAVAADQEAMDSVHTAQDALPAALPDQAAPVAASVGLPLETAAASTGIAFVSSPAAADHEATSGAAPPVVYPRDSHVVLLPLDANNPEGWIASVHNAQDVLPALHGPAARVAGSAGLRLETAAASTGIAFVSIPVAADREATAGGAAPVVYPHDPHAVPLPPAANNPEGWIARDDDLQFAYMMTVTVQMIDDKDLSLPTAPRVLYEVLMPAAILLLGLGLMTAITARSSSSPRSLYYRRVSSFCARFGSILCTTLLVVFASCSAGRLGWIAGVLCAALIAGIMATIWIRGKPDAATPTP